MANIYWPKDVISSKIAGLHGRHRTGPHDKGLQALCSLRVCVCVCVPLGWRNGQLNAKHIKVELRWRPNDQTNQWVSLRYLALNRSILTLKVRFRLLLRFRQYGILRFGQARRACSTRMRGGPTEHRRSARPAGGGGLGEVVWSRDGGGGSGFGQPAFWMISTRLRFEKEVESCHEFLTSSNSAAPRII